MMMRMRMSGEAGEGCQVKEGPDGSGTRIKRDHEMITAASQGFLDKPDQVCTVNGDLFWSLVVNAIPALEAGIADRKNASEYFANSPVGKRLLIARGQHQALRSALSHLVFTEL